MSFSDNFNKLTVILIKCDQFFGGGDGYGGGEQKQTLPSCW